MVSSSSSSSSLPVFLPTPLLLRRPRLPITGALLLLRADTLPNRHALRKGPAHASLPSPPSCQALREVLRLRPSPGHASARVGAPTLLRSGGACRDTTAGLQSWLFALWCYGGGEGMPRRGRARCMKGHARGVPGLLRVTLIRSIYTSIRVPSSILVIYVIIHALDHIY